jgi:hypothetical protein
MFATILIEIVRFMPRLNVRSSFATAPARAPGRLYADGLGRMMVYEVHHRE